MPMSGLAYMHRSGNGWDHLCIVEHPDAHIIFPSWCSSEYSLSLVIQHMNYTQVQNFNKSHTQMQTMQVIKHFMQKHLLKLNVCCIALSSQQEALVSIWTRVHNLIKMVSSPHKKWQASEISRPVHTSW